MLSSLLLAGFMAGQGQALQLSYPTEPGLTAISVRWSGHAVPFVQQDDRWLATVGVDLDSRPGDHAVDVTFTYSDGRTRAHSEPVLVVAEQYPTTELTVEERFVELSPEDQARADREAAETRAIYDTFTAERFWTEPFQVPVDGAADGRNFGHRRVFNGQPRAPHSGADLRARTGTPITRRIAAGSCSPRISSIAATPCSSTTVTVFYDLSAPVANRCGGRGHRRARPTARLGRRDRAGSRVRTCIGVSGSSTRESTLSR